MRCLPLGGGKIRSFDGKYYYWLNRSGLLHSFNGQPTIARFNGRKEWRIKGVLIKAVGDKE